MKQQNLKSVIASLLALLSINAHAYNAEIDGIYYYLQDLPNTASVTSQSNNYGSINRSYSGVVNIPATITYNEKTYIVTSIEMRAFSDCTGLTSVIIPNSVTSIGSSAFSGCTGLTSVTIPNSVTTIGMWAFADCSSLTSIDIPNSVTTIEDGTFAGCSSLTSIDIPNSVTTIKGGAFAGCKSLTSPIKNEKIFVFMPLAYEGKYTIPNGITSIIGSAFSGCTGLTSIDIPNSVTSIGYSAFEGCTGLTSVDIPNSVTSIGSGAFSGCTGLTSVTIPNSVTSINWSAFSGCTSLTSIVIPNSVTSIDLSAFSGCTSLTSIVIPNSVTSIGVSAFSGCSGLTSIDIPNSVTSIGKGSFKDCSGLTSIAIPDGVTSIEENTFSGCNSLISVDIPYGITTIGNYSFSGCSSLTAVTIPNSVWTIGTDAFKDCGLTSVVIPRSTSRIVPGAFSGCSSLNEIVVDSENSTYDSRNNCNAIIETKSNKLISGCNSTLIPDDVKSIGSYAFYGCSGLSALFIPKSVESIDVNAVQYCTGLMSIAVDEANPVYDSRNNCNAIISTSDNRIIVACNNTIMPDDIVYYVSPSPFLNCESYTFPEGTKTIGEMFKNCSKLKSIHIPRSVTSIERGAFSGCTSLKKVIFEDGNESLNFTSSYYTEDPKWFGDCPIDSLYIGREMHYTYTTGNKTYTYSPFQDNKHLRAVVFSDNVRTIPDKMFYNCSNLDSVKMSESITQIGYSAFYKCENLPSIKIYNGIESIGTYAFFGCGNIKSVVIPPSVKTIEDHAFSLTNLSSIIIEDSKEYLTANNGRSNAVFYCYNHAIDSVYMGRNCSQLISCNRIKHLTLGNVTSLNYDDLKCDTINVLEIKENTDTLCLHYSYYGVAFNGVYIDSVFCDRVVTVKKNSSTLEVYPFNNVASSFKLEFGKNLTSVGEKMFYGSKISSLSISGNIKEIASTSFQNCPNLSSVVIEDGDSPLDFGEGGNFFMCPLKDVYVGRNLKFVKSSPFGNNREGITSLTFGKDVTEIPDKAFSGLKNITQLKLPLLLKKIGTQAFYGCEGLTTLTIPSDVTEIGQQAFDLCRGLTSLRFNDGKKELNFLSSQGQLNNAFVNSPIEEVYLGRNMSYSSVSPFFAMESLKKLTLGKFVSALPDRAFAGCPSLNEVHSNAGSVPTTGEFVFTESYLPDATLYVPYSLHNEYKATSPWNLFGNMMTMEGIYDLCYMVDGEVYKTVPLEFGATITPEVDPVKENYTFSGWSEIPETMPAKDVVVTGTFTIIDDITDIDGTDAMPDGKRIEDGRMVIYRNGKKYTTMGVELK